MAWSSSMSGDSSDDRVPSSHAYRDAFGAPPPAKRGWIAPVVVVTVALAVAIAVLTWPRSDDAPAPVIVPDAAAVDAGARDAEPADRQERRPRPRGE
jgi:hypothetical protein